MLELPARFGVETNHELRTRNMSATTTMTATANVIPPNLQELLAPLLPAIPPAAVSSQPAEGVLPFLSPILRQRVKMLSGSGSDGWLKLLCYDTTKAQKLCEIASSGALEPHPVSGEVEVDWDYDAETRYRRADEETMQAMVALSELGIAFQLVWAINDAEGGKDGWRVGELTTSEKPSPFAAFGGASSLAEAEKLFAEKASQSKQSSLSVARNIPSSADAMDEDEDDGYWDRYDATPANRTPANTRSPAPGRVNGHAASRHNNEDEDEGYYAQYDDVQPAMDNYDPDEAADAAQISPPLGLGEQQLLHNRENGVIAPAPIPITHTANVTGVTAPLSPPSSSMMAEAALAHPRPESSASSNGSQTVARLEATAGKNAQSEFGVKQHVSRSIRSLFMLARASGIERDEFNRLVQTEMDLLSLSDSE